MAAKIQKFTWEGKNQKGQIISGTINARTFTLAKAELRQQGIVPLKVKRKAQPLFSMQLGGGIKSLEISVFTRQLSTMISAGIPIVQSLDILTKGTENSALNSLLITVKSDIESGISLSAAFAKHPRYFNSLFCNLIAAGEQSGQLEQMLDRISTYREKTESLRAKVKKALFYPMTVIVIALLITAGLLIFVVPQFEKIFANFGADLPVVTKFILSLSRAFSQYWYVIFGLIGIAIVAFTQALKKSKKFVAKFQEFLLNILIVGPILKKSAIARFARTLSITFAAGLPLVEALHSVAGATGNIVYERVTLQIREDVQTGQQIYQSMTKFDVFPAMVVQMIAIGEESGSLEFMLAKVADFYEEEVDNAVANLSSLLEPIIMVVLGIIIGGLVVALYMPIFKLGGII